MQLPTDDRISALVEKAQQLDEAAFDELYSLYTDAIFHFMYYRCGDYQLAEDLTSGVFLRIVEALPKFVLPAKGEALAWTSWVFRIASNRLRDHFRKDRQHIVAIDEQLAGSDDPTERADREAEYSDVRQALTQLTDEQQQVLVLRFVEELSIEDVAVITGQTVGGVKSMQHRALKSLSRMMQRVWAFSEPERVS